MKQCCKNCKYYNNYGLRKKYKEALARAKTILKRGYYISGDIEVIFPELAESEDERIRKAISQCVEDMRGQFEKLYSVHHKDAIAWLEKQGEKKPADKAKTKFHEGDWITDGIFTSQIIRVGENTYSAITESGDNYFPSYKDIDDYHLWTIQDAKDGDVLAGSHGTFHFMGESNGYCGVLNDNTFIGSTGNNEWTEGLHPATKEQRDLLFQKMKEAGYEWDAEKKELKKI